MSRAPFPCWAAAALASLACAGEVGGGASEGDIPADAAPAALDGAAGAACLAATAPCAQTAECCEGLACGTTTLGMVCCGEAGAPCATANGEDCCGDLLCVDGLCGDGPSLFKAPYPCDQRWTYSHHAAEVRLALDFIRDDGGLTDGESVLASASGVAHLLYEAGGAGNYVALDHPGGWQTYYFHLSSFLVDEGAAVTQGQPIGTVGSTGASSGPHLHYEQLLDGVGQVILINGHSLAPYPSFYGERSLTSDNGCP